MIEIEPAWFWLALAVILVGTAFFSGTHHFFLFDLVFSAFFLALLTAIFPGLPPLVQAAAFLAAVILLIPVFYWLVFQVTGTAGAQLVGHGSEYRGRVGVVEPRGTGFGVCIGGEVFPARAADGGALREGQQVAVERLEGITAVVRVVPSTAHESPDPPSR